MNISHSMLSSFYICPERASRQYVFKERAPFGLAAKIGNGLHGAVEADCNVKLTRGKGYPLGKLKEAARESYLEAIKEGVFIPPEEMSSATRLINDGFNQVLQLTELYHRELSDQLKPVLVEKYFKADLGFTIFEKPAYLSGRIDIYNAGGWLADIKTAARKWNQKKADQTLQAVFYDYFIEMHYGERPKKITFEVFVKTKKPSHQRLETSRQRSDFDALLRRVEAVIDMIESGNFPPADPEGWACSPVYCYRYYQCPYIPKHKQVLPKKTAA